MRVSRRYVPRIIAIVWSATSSMKVSGTLVTGIPLSVALAMSMPSVPTLPTAITLHLSSPSMTVAVRPWPEIMASASRASLRNASSLPASATTISAPMGANASSSSA